MPTANGDNGRNERGQFTEGNAGGPGNPYARQVATYRAALFRAVSEADVEELVRSLLDRAKKGDNAAARLILPYLVGRSPAIEATEPDAASGGISEAASKMLEKLRARHEIIVTYSEDAPAVLDRLGVPGEVRAANRA